MSLDEKSTAYKSQIIYFVTHVMYYDVNWTPESRMKNRRLIYLLVFEFPVEYVCGRTYNIFILYYLYFYIYTGFKRIECCLKEISGCVTGTLPYELVFSLTWGTV